jgi:hypothetical protein
MNIARTLYENLFSFKHLFAYFTNETLNKSSRVTSDISCSGGVGGSNPTSGHAASTSLLLAAPTILPIS